MAATTVLAIMMAVVWIHAGSSFYYCCAAADAVIAMDLAMAAAADANPYAA